MNRRELRWYKHEIRSYKKNRMEHLMPDRRSPMIRVELMNLRENRRKRKKESMEWMTKMLLLLKEAHRLQVFD